MTVERKGRLGQQKRLAGGAEMKDCAADRCRSKALKPAQQAEPLEHGEDFRGKKLAAHFVPWERRPFVDSDLCAVLNRSQRRHRTRGAGSAKMNDSQADQRPPSS